MVDDLPSPLNGVLHQNYNAAKICGVSTMGLRLWLGLRKRKPHLYGDLSPEAAATAHILPDRPAFTDYLHRRANWREPNSPRLGKLDTADFIRSLGLRCADTYAVLSKPSEFEPDNFPDRLVVKPTGLCSTKGVMLLRKQPNGKFFGMIRGAEVDVETIRAEQETWQGTVVENHPNANAKIIVEELITDEFSPDIIPFDYKCYTFNGSVRFILQINRNVKPAAISFFRDDFYPIDFEPYTEPKLRKAQRGTHRKPDCWKEILGVAQHVSQALKTPFISVDTYASSKVLSSVS